MTTGFDVTDLNVRQVITPSGIGELIGVDDKDNPVNWAVLVKVEGLRFRKSMTFTQDELEEVEK